MPSDSSVWLSTSACGLSDDLQSAGLHSARAASCAGLLGCCRSCLSLHNAVRLLALQATCTQDCWHSSIGWPLFGHQPTGAALMGRGRHEHLG